MVYVHFFEQYIVHLHWDFWQREKFYPTRLICMLWNAWFREVYWEENLRGASSLSAASNLLADAAAAVAPQ